ncbi:MAG: hypothetical protein NTY48_00290 [Candidatus Diapherotrites archaeon]|nr:hypothetical protein [Candidatus Diapherotrites archaeon]
MDLHKGIVRQIFANGRRVRIAKNHSVCEIDNNILDLKIGDKVLCSDFKVIRRIGDPHSSTLFDFQ